MHQHLLRMYVKVVSRWADDRDRGDVPGWVMVTLMSALLVVALVGIFRDELVRLVQGAFDSIQ